MTAMLNPLSSQFHFRSVGLAASACVSVLLAACGGGGNASNDSSPPATSAPLASAVTVLDATVDALPDDEVAQQASPTFHVAPVELYAPDDSDSQDGNASALRGPRSQSIPAELSGLSTRGLTIQKIDAVRRSRAAASANGESAAPMASSSSVTTYTPAQIRAAYGLPTLPASGASLTDAQAAQFGRGQTIYIVNAMNNPNVVAELAAFNQKFGLPTCTSRVLPANTALPLATASTSGCELVIAYSGTNGSLVATAPAYDSGWATEIALDVQWAHATAPLARIVLIEAPDASVNSLAAAVRLANSMGPGVVSMSFGANEGSWVASFESVFSASNMSYLAATGDSGVSVSWPSVSANVLAVGGTSLTYGGSGARSETAWSGTGGGISAYVAKPAYQSAVVPGMLSTNYRVVADVAFNANPYTGQYVAVQPSGSATTNWISAGGTSLSTPQWAGVLAVVNATRALSAKARLGAPHSLLYGQISSVPGTYAANFADILSGSHGSCATCAAKAGFDQLTGLGTPNVSSLVAALSGGSSTPVATAPVVTPAAINGSTGTPLSFTISATGSNPLTYSITGAPSGMTVAASTGVVTWASPVAGKYSITASVKDSKTGLSGQAVYTVTVTTPAPPSVGSGSVSGKVGVRLNFSVAVTSSNPVTYSLTGAPAGMSVTSAGLVTWPNPVVGTYKVTVTAKNTVTGQTGSGIYTVTITKGGPVITAAGSTGVANKAVSGSIAISDPGATSLQITIAGAPLGMQFYLSGTTINYVWGAPLTGSYVLVVTVRDNLGQSAQANVPIKINAK